MVPNFSNTWAAADNTVKTTIISSERRFCPVVEAVTETSFRITESGEGGVVIVGTVVSGRSPVRSARAAKFFKKGDRRHFRLLSLGQDRR
jgi:hypothetical protein